MTISLTPVNAKPDPETIKRVAECVHCWQMLEWSKVGKVWFHSATGNRECS